MYDSWQLNCIHFCNPLFVSDFSTSLYLVTLFFVCSMIRISRNGWHTLINFLFHIGLTFGVFAGGINQINLPFVCQTVSCCFPLSWHWIIHSSLSALKKLKASLDDQAVSDSFVVTGSYRLHLETREASVSPGKRSYTYEVKCVIIVISLYFLVSVQAAQIKKIVLA